MDPNQSWPVRYAPQIAKLERWRALGWLRYTAWAMLKSLLGVAAVFYIFVGWGWMKRMPLEIACVAASVLLLTQIYWWIIPCAIDFLHEPDRTRQCLYREGDLISLVGLIAMLTAGFLPLGLGRAAAGADLMLTISGGVLAVWGMSKIYRFWIESPNWNAISTGQRIVRLYGQQAIGLILILATIVRVHAYYGDAPWAETVRRLIGP